MLAIAKITSKGQTTIPQDVRVALKLAPGDLIAWDVRADGTANVWSWGRPELCQSRISKQSATR